MRNMRKTQKYEKCKNAKYLKKSKTQITRFMRKMQKNAKNAKNPNNPRIRLLSTHILGDFLNILRLIASLEWDLRDPWQVNECQIWTKARCNGQFDRFIHDSFLHPAAFLSNFIDFLLNHAKIHVFFSFKLLEFRNSLFYVVFLH